VEIRIVHAVSANLESIDVSCLIFGHGHLPGSIVPIVAALVA
jgi:hypothetical protein